jgi:hypothetical protein
MTFSAPAYFSRCKRTYRFMDTMSSLCPHCSEARERLVELKRDEDRRREAMRAGGVPSPQPPPRPRIDDPQKSAADVHGPRKAPVAAARRFRKQEVRPRGR